MEAISWGSKEHFRALREMRRMQEEIMVKHPNEVAREIIREHLQEMIATGRTEIAHTQRLPMGSAAKLSAAFERHASYIPRDRAIQASTEAILDIVRREFVEMDQEEREAFMNALSEPSLLSQIMLHEFWPIEAGGGCVGLRHDGDEMYTLVTAHGDPIAPIVTDILYTIGWYDSETDAGIDSVDVIGLQALSQRAEA